MKQTNEQFMALIGHYIFIIDGYDGTLEKAKVLAFICDDKGRSLRLSYEGQQDCKNVKVREWELEDSGYIMTSETTIEMMKDVEGDFVVADA